VLPKAANLRCSLYADDAAIFAYPANTELDHLLKILNFFGECSGLKINISKTENFPIRMDTQWSLNYFKISPARFAVSLGDI